MSHPLILASGSAIRATLLIQAGIAFTKIPADIDEEALKDDGLARALSPKAIALKLSQEKALHVSKEHPGWVIGADSIVELEGELISKSADMTQARDLLTRFSGRTHYLHSAVSIASGDDIVWSTVRTAQMNVRRLKADIIDDYLRRVGEGILKSVGCYQLEGLGVHLFDSIDGDYFTVLGLPLLPLLARLRHLDVIS